MHEYELVYIARPDMDEAAVVDLTNRVKTWITDGGGQIAKVDQWGKKKLAYPIRKQIEGQYTFVEFSMPPAYSAELERNLRYLEPVLRFLIKAK